MNDLREQLAAHVHEIWAGWMRHVFSIAKTIPDGNKLILAEDAKRWMRQARSDFETQLSEPEKDIDRLIADGILDVIEQSGRKFCECGEKEQG